jgi:chromate transporter
MSSDPRAEIPVAASGSGPLPALAPPPSAWLFLRVWLLLGLQSFGGGTATLALIRRAFVQEYGWISEAEFTRDWALVQLAPGINLLAITILIGRRVVGLKGVPLALIGLLLPSVTITVLLTASYVHIQRLHSVQAGLRGLIPATVGLGLLTAAQMARPPLADSRQEGKTSLTISLLILIGSGFAGVVLHWPVILILAGAGAVSALACWQRTLAAQKEPPAP